jgi:Carboxypeptidase regulatory-like domain
MRRLHLVVSVVLIGMGSSTVHGAAPGSVLGSVRDSAGVPQMGAVVELLRPDLTVISSVYTDSEGRFRIPSVASGRYALKAMNTSFLPSLRENVRVLRSSTVVNMTLSTLYEVMQWLPSEPRAVNTQQDDWKWTLRSAANRPLLRWLEDGPLVVVSDGSGTAPKLKARLMASGQEGTFGESGERFTAAVEDTPSNSRELLARVDFAPDSNAGMESMLGFRQDLGFAGSVQSVAAFAIHPEIDAPETEAGGLDEAAIRSWENLNLGDAMEAEVGSAQVVARFGGHSPNTVTAALPYAKVAWREGNSTIHYGMTTMVPGGENAEETQAQTWLPRVSVRNGDLVLEHGLHQEIGWERKTDRSGMAVLVFADKIDNPILDAMSRFAGNGAAQIAGSGSALFDPASGMLRAAGPNFSSAGVAATVVRQLPGGGVIRLSYANGDALAMPAASGPASLEQVNATARPRRAQTYALSLSGTLEGTGTRWRASYRWQPEDTVTSVAPYSANAMEPYLNLHICQPIHMRHDGASGFEALLDLRNLLAQGYRPYLLGDGSVVVFAQDQRGVQGGLAFTF